MRIPGRGAPSIAYLVVGLGNPGKRYAGTRHNIGLRAVEEVVARLGGSWRGRWHGRVCETRDGDERVALLAPETFMNESGRSVAPAMRFYKLPPERLVVVHDELDLPLGDIRAKSGGGLAGPQRPAVSRAVDRHPGLPPRADRHRPAGAGRPAARRRLGAAAVRAGTDDDDLVQRGADCTLAVVRDGIDAAMRQFN